MVVLYYLCFTGVWFIAKTRLRLVCSHTLRLGMVIINWVLSERMGCLAPANCPSETSLLYVAPKQFNYRNTATCDTGLVQSLQYLICEQETVWPWTQDFRSGFSFRALAICVTVEWVARNQFREVNGKQELFLLAQLCVIYGSLLSVALLCAVVTVLPLSTGTQPLGGGGQSR